MSRIESTQLPSDTDSDNPDHHDMSDNELTSDPDSIWPGKWHGGDLDWVKRLIITGAHIPHESRPKSRL